MIIMMVITLNRMMTVMMMMIMMISSSVVKAGFRVLELRVVTRGREYAFFELPNALKALDKSDRCFP